MYNELEEKLSNEMKNAEKMRQTGKKLDIKTQEYDKSVSKFLCYF